MSGSPEVSFFFSSSSDSGDQQGCMICGNLVGCASSWVLQGFAECIVILWNRIQIGDFLLDLRSVGLPVSLHEVPTW